jgi:hypothetical protein
LLRRLRRRTKKEERKRRWMLSGAGTQAGINDDE